MTGAFSGCHYVFVENARCSPGGAYFETGTETFVGIYDGEFGTFGTNYVFTAPHTGIAPTWSEKSLDVANILLQTAVAQVFSRVSEGDST
jgi:hypothetical protein